MRPIPTLVYKQTQTAGRTLGIEVQSLEVRSPDDFDMAFETVRQERSDALITVEDPLTGPNQKRIVDFAAIDRLPPRGRGATRGARAEASDAGCQVSPPRPAIGRASEVMPLTQWPRVGYYPDQLASSDYQVRRTQSITESRNGLSSGRTSARGL